MGEAVGAVVVWTIDELTKEVLHGGSERWTPAPDHDGVDSSIPLCPGNVYI